MLPPEIREQMIRQGAEVKRLKEQLDRELEHHQETKTELNETIQNLMNEKNELNEKISKLEQVIFSKYLLKKFIFFRNIIWDKQLLFRVQRGAMHWTRSNMKNYKIF